MAIHAGRFKANGSCAFSAETEVAVIVDIVY